MTSSDAKNLFAAVVELGEEVRGFARPTSGRLASTRQLLHAPPPPTAPYPLSHRAQIEEYNVELDVREKKFQRKELWRDALVSIRR